MAGVTLSDIIKATKVPKELRDEVREMIVIGTGKTVFTEEEADSLIRVVSKMLSEGKLKEHHRRKKAVATTIQFKKEHRPNRLDICPICRDRMVRASLRDDRPVMYCPKHRVVLPLPVDR